MEETNKQEKIDRIYEVISNKELSFGCRATIEDYDGVLHNVEIVNLKEGYYKVGNELRYTDEFEEETEVIIGHPVLLGDVLDWLEDDNLFISDAHIHMDFIFPNWEQRRLPIQSQSEDCIDYIYTLIQN